MPLLLVAFLWGTGAAAQVVPPADLSRLSPADFSDEELDLPYYLAHFHRIANSVRMDGPNRGFIDVAVWRRPENNAPHNARVMENILSLAFFYATDRPWNPYYGHPAVRERLETALTFWTDIQNEEGLFTSWHADDWGIAPTSFAAKFFGEVLRLLETGPPIDRRLHQDVIDAHRKSVMAVLTDAGMYEHGKDWANHYTNVWGGALAHLDLYPNSEMERLLQARLVEGLQDFQSPAGYFYEHRGPDFGFDIETEHSNHLMAWHYLRGTDLSDVFSQSVNRWYDWLMYNAAIEPDGTGFTLNHSFETRLNLPFYRENRQTTYGETCTPLAEVVVLARAFCESEEERTARLRTQRRELERRWPNVEPLDANSNASYSPYAFLHRDHVRWHPTAEQKSAAIRLLPYLRDRTFTHQRADSRQPITATYIRRSPYYAAFTTGEPLTPQQRYGLGFVWTADYGAVLQSHSASVEGAWGTRRRGSDNVYETTIVDPLFRVDGERVTVQARPQGLGVRPFSITYRLGTQGEKTVTFMDREIVVSILHRGAFSEHIPFLVESANDIDIDRGRIRIEGEPSISILFDGGTATSTVETGFRAGRKRSASVIWEASNALTYRIRFD